MWGFNKAEAKEEEHELPEVPKGPNRGTSESPPPRRRSIYDDLPVSLATRAFDPDTNERTGGGGGVSPTRSVGGDRLTHASGVEPPTPEEVSGPIHQLFKPIFLKFWPHTPGSSEAPPASQGLDQVEVHGRSGSRGDNGKKKIKKETIYGKVLEEVDPFVFEDTFCVLTNKFGNSYICRYSATRSLFLFTPMSYIRRLCVYVISQPLFDILIMLTILANCIALATDTKLVELNPLTGKWGVTEDDLPKYLEITFLVIYSLEMILKVIAKGFLFNKFSYLRNGWNILDFAVVWLGYFTEIQTTASNSATNTKQTTDTIQILRTFRVLRAIKTISILPGLRMMINALVNAIIQLVEVMLLTFFCLCIFSLFALEIFMGKFHQVCVLIRGSTTANNLVLAGGNFSTIPIDPNSPQADYEYKTWIHNPMNWLRRSFPKDEFVVCSNDTEGRVCPPDYVCLPDLAENPDNGWTSFDHFGLSMLSTLQLLTLDYWERLYELVMSTVGPWCLIFFIGVIFFGSFYLLNLMLAVVAMSYEAEAQSSQLKPLSKHQKLTLHRSHSTFSFDEPMKLNLQVLSSTSHRRTPAERMALAKKLRNTSMGKRKKRRAFRRKPPAKPSANEGGSNTGTGGGTTPDGGRSTGGSISGSIYESASPLPPRKRERNKALMSGVLGERPCYVEKPKSVSASSAMATATKKPKRIVTIDEGDRVVSVLSKKVPPPPPVAKSLERGASVDSGVADVRPASGSASGSGGIRVSARVKSAPRRHDTEQTRFYLETEPSFLMRKKAKNKKSAIHDAVMRMLGRNLHESLDDAEKAGDAEAGEPTPPPDEIPVIAIDQVGDMGQAYESDISVDLTASSRSSIRIREAFAPKLTVESEKTQDRRHVSQSNPFFHQMKVRLDPLVSHWGFESFITTCIIINTILLASEHHEQPEWLTDTIRVGSHCFTAVFTLECIIKIIALQRSYFHQPWNIFDLCMVFISFADIMLDTVLEDGGFAFRVFRLLRIFKLAQSWITMKVLLNIIFSTFGALGNLTLVLAIFIYIFAILGMQILGDGFLPENFELESTSSEGYPRWHYQDFWHAFMMIFRVIAQEWIEPLVECLDAHDGGQEWRCFVIYIPVLIFGTFIVLNLFLALLLNSFNSQELKAQREKEKELSGKSDTLKNIVGMLIAKNRRALIALPAIVAAASEQAKQGQELAGPSKSLSRATQEELARRRMMKQKFIDAAKKVIMKNRKAAAIRAIRRAEEGWNEMEKVRLQPQLIFVKNPLLEANSIDPDTVSVKSEQEDNMPANCLPDCLLNHESSLCNYVRRAPFVRWMRFRTLCLRIVSNSVFEWTILILILASSITLCFEDVHLEEKPRLKLALFILNSIFTTIFIVEMALKWCALGLVRYFTGFWTLLDIFIVTVSVISLGFDVQNRTWEPIVGTRRSAVSSLKALRTLRALRPLRAISRWQGMKVVVNALMYAIPSIFNVLLVCLLFWLVFAIMGVQFFKGKFYKCIVGDSGAVVSADEVPDMMTCCETRTDTVWINTTPNFDNVFEAYLSLFQVATFEGWMELMRAASDIQSSRYNIQPRRDASYYANIYFVVFIIFGTFFTLNLFIGVIIDNFNMLKKKYEGNLVEALLTPSQMRYYTAMKKLGRKKPQRVIRRPQSKCLALFYDISMSRRFEIAIFVLIFLNMVVMAFEHHGQREIYHHILTGFNSFFSTIYALEAIVKIVGMRHYYFTIPWNVFDFALVLFSILDLFLTDVQWSLPFPPTMLRVVRVFRIGRVLRLIKAAKGIRKLLFALIVSLPALFNIGALLALIMFIYAILGMALFKDANYFGTMDEMFNFKTFFRACMMLLRYKVNLTGREDVRSRNHRLMTAAGWNDVLHSLVVEVPRCNVDSYRKLICGKDDEPECISRMVSVTYMVSYIIITNLIVINMYIAIILENFVEANQDEEIGIVEDDLEMFYIRWSRYDPTATQFIGFDQLSEFLASLDPPLDIPRPNIVAIVSFNLPIARGNKIHCLDILHALVKHALGHVDDSEEFRKIQEQMEAKFRKQFPSRKLLDIVSSTRIWKIQHNAAIIIQRAWRAYLARKHAATERVKSTQTIKSAGTAHHGFGHKLGQFFHVGGDKRRRSSLRDGGVFSLRPGGSGKRTSPLATVRDEGHYLPKSQKSTEKHEPAELHSACPRNSYSSQSSSSASPLPIPRIETAPTSPPQSRREDSKPTRRLSPSRLSGGSFDVAMNFGLESTPISNQLLGAHLPKSIAIKTLTPPVEEEPTHFTHPQCISYVTSPLNSLPTSPSSPPKLFTRKRSSVTVQIHEASQ